MDRFRNHLIVRAFLDFLGPKTALGVNVHQNLWTQTLGKISPVNGGYG